MLAVALDERPAALRIDVWGPIEPPASMVRAFAVEHPDAIVEISMRRNLSAALDALWRNELDIALGNVAHLKPSLPDGLSSVLVTCFEIAGLVQESDDLERATFITPEELRRRGLGVSVQASRQEFAAFASEYAGAVGAPLSTECRNTDLDGLVDSVPADPTSVMLVPAGWPVPEDRGLRLIPLRPAPLLPWYAVWRTANRHRLVPRLVRALTATLGLPDLIDNAHWLPAGLPRELWTSEIT